MYTKQHILGIVSRSFTYMDRDMPIQLYIVQCSFFPQTIRDWNVLPDSLISSAEDAEDCLAKFSSLMRAKD